MRVIVSGFSLFLTAFVGSSSAAAEAPFGEPLAGKPSATFVVRDLGTLGGSTTDVYGLNDRGDVVGSSYTAAGERHAFVWRNGVMTDLQRPGEFGTAYAINNNGDIAGRVGAYAAVWTNGERVEIESPSPTWALFINDRGDVVGGPLGGFTGWFRWRDGVSTDLGNFIASAVNERGDIAGTHCVRDHACVWRDGVATDLGILPGDNRSIARAINVSGQVVGGSFVFPGPGPFHPVLWQNGTIADLGTLGGTFGIAVAINDRGQIAGYSTTADGETHASLWVNGEMSDLGTLGGTYSRAFAISDPGDVVGTSGDASEASYVFLWRDGIMKKLWLFNAAAGQGNTRDFHINARGEVAATCIAADGHHHGCIYQLAPPRRDSNLRSGSNE